MNVPEGDLENADRYLSPRGFILFDDSADGSGWEVCKVVEEVLNSSSYHLIAKNPNYLVQKSLAARVPVRRLFQNSLRSADRHVSDGLLQRWAFDTAIACHVLEHVLTVLHGNDLKVKMELSRGISPADRLRLAGQVDHQRIYGEDFAGLLRQTGFHVTPVDESSFPASFVKTALSSTASALYTPAGHQPP